MKIGLCNITQGDKELPQLKEMIESVKGQVDQVFITTNRKHKKTKKWLESKGYHHSHLDWNDDFSEQRNFNFSQVPDDFDYIIWLDTDDLLVGAEYLQDVAKMAKKRELDTVFLTYWYGCLFDGYPSKESLLEVEMHHPRERIMNPRRVKWKGRLHETPMEIPGINYKYSQLIHLPDKPEKTFPIAVLHTGAKHVISEGKLKERMERNRRILELQLKEERDQGEVDPRTLLYLMKIYTERDDEEYLKKCIDMGSEYLDKSGWDEERAVCYSLMAKSYSKLEKDKTASELLIRAIEEYPHNPMFHLMLADAYYNLGKHKKMIYWLESGLDMKADESTAVMKNVYQMKVLAAELMLKRFLHVEKNVGKALEAAKMLFRENPTKNNQKNFEHLESLNDLNEACGNLDNLIQYLGDEDEEKAVFSILESLPLKIKNRPFVTRLRNKYVPPREWGKDEICYFANFGGKHFEKWDMRSLDKGIGGSETAVIRLSEEWAKMGYKVTVFGDPETPGITQEFESGGRVIYRPYWQFNRKDKFNIFIQWRDGSLAGKISAKKFYVDLHDVFHEMSYEKKQEAIDNLMVKSKYHKTFAPNIKNIKIIGNGI